jgi:photosystem II stability/assembly factor-like uncharacterized protein
MVLPLMLVLGLSLGQSPDFLEVQPLGGGYQVLAGGGLVYRWSGRGELTLEAQLGSPATALYTCDARHSLAVGPGGRVFASASGLAWRQSTLEGGKSLWAVAGAGCAQVLIAGDGGLWQGSLTGEAPVFSPVALPTRLPLYGLAVEREQAVAVGAGGTVLLRRFARQSFTQVKSGTEAPLLAVALLGGERYVVAGAGGLWLGYADTLRQVYVDEAEVFTRVVFADARVGVALGQEKALVTTDGGESWRVLPHGNLLGAVPLGGGRFLAVGRAGAWVMLDTAEPSGGPTPKLKVARRVPEAPPEKAPRPRPAPETPVAEAPPVPTVRREPAPPPDPKCVLKLDRKDMRGAFLDIQRAGQEVLVVGSDGTVRRVEGAALPVVHEAGEPLLGLAVSPDGRQVAAVGYGVVARSSDGGWTFRTERTPTDALHYAAAFAGEDVLLIFDANGRGWRSVKGGPFEEVSMPRAVTYFGAAFADARRGYVVGECGTLLETVDGGASWKVLPAPFSEGIQGVLVSDDTLYVSGSGVWRSEDRGRKFQQVLSMLSCVRLAGQGRAVAAACGGGMGSALRYAANGRDFQPVPVPYSHALMSVALLPGEVLLAVGVREQFIRARPSGGTIAYRSEAIQEWRSFIDKHQRVRMQEAPSRPARKVAVAPLPSP